MVTPRNWLWARENANLESHEPLLGFGVGETKGSGQRKKWTINKHTAAIDHHPQQRQPQNGHAAEIQPEPPHGNNGSENDPEHEPRPLKLEWVISIKEKLKQARQDNEARSWTKLSIYRTPHYLMDGDDKAYVPQIVSLGPYHHGRADLHHMEQHKWRCLHCILERSHSKIDLYLDSMKKVENKARACYEGTISMSSDDFVEMMVLDGCFVIELFQGVKKETGFEGLGYAPDDPIFSLKCGSMPMIQRDMIMLENQIPLFILDQLFCLQQGDPNQEGPIAKLALQFFEPLKPMKGCQANSSNNGPEFDPSLIQDELPCLELFRQSLLNPKQGPKKEGTQVSSQKRQRLIHCVTELREAGVKFRERKTDRFMDIQFKDGILWIPRLHIDDGTRSLFLNLIAFEQSHIDDRNDITAYVIFMDHLINSSEDVRHLHKRGIIEHWLGSDTEVADLFNRLCKEVVFDLNRSYLSELSADLNVYYSLKWNNWRAILKNKYFDNPWSIISFIAALVLLALTFLQSFYAVYGSYRPRS
ncbi:hypothetical protein BT93_L2325 [Corymbia citriodora subsp. variegata]|uniref:Uncharacterized protein n=1 Tax=Corymbia citriodora subsp. variegata TaxID=360336 RepID=A0A8T0CK73_CORYI|nr:hypothetical protein BT93_L2325 [Corymbia citriodora subsp. variegata]